MLAGSGSCIITVSFSREPPRKGTWIISPTCSLQVPAEIDLRAADFGSVEGQHLGVAEAASVDLSALVAHDHLVARLDQPDELELLDRLRVGPAALEVPVPVDPHVGWAEEPEVVAQTLLEHTPIPRFVRPIAVTGDLRPFCGKHCDPLSVARLLWAVACRVPEPAEFYAAATSP